LPSAARLSPAAATAPPKPGLPKPMKGCFAVEGFAVWRSSASDDTAGSTLTAMSFISHAAPA
jgi:hypothetical protein